MALPMAGARPRPRRMGRRQPGCSPRPSPPALVLAPGSGWWRRWWSGGRCAWLRVMRLWQKAVTWATGLRGRDRPRCMAPGGAAPLPAPATAASGAPARKATTSRRPPRPQSGRWSTVAGCGQATAREPPLRPGRNYCRPPCHPGFPLTPRLGLPGACGSKAALPLGVGQAIREEFGFDPSADPLWGKQIEGGDGQAGFTSYGFHCPAEKLDAMYAMHGSHRFPGRLRILNR
jgi:hypothetical protein